MVVPGVERAPRPPGLFDDVGHAPVPAAEDALQIGGARVVATELQPEAPGQAQQDSCLRSISSSESMAHHWKGVCGLGTWR